MIHKPLNTFHIAFSLVELLFTIVIISILLLTVPPLLTTATQSIHLASKQNALSVQSTILLQHTYDSNASFMLTDTQPIQRDGINALNPHITFQKTTNHDIVFFTLNPKTNQRNIIITQEE